MEVNLLGTPAAMAARLREYTAAGTTELCAIFCSLDAAMALRQVKLFADGGIPAATLLVR